MKRIPGLVIFLILMLIAGRGVSQKIDTIVHINGDVLTGDLKKLVYGVVTWKMDGMGTISLEEIWINTIKSPKEFEIKLKNGLLYYGSFDTSGIDRKVNIVFANGRELVSIDEIVEIYPIRRNFWLRTSGNFSLGINYSKGSGVATVAFSGGLYYRKRKSNYSIVWDNNNTYQADTLSFSKADATIGWQQTIKNKWSFGTYLGLSQNTQLGTKLRFNFTPLGIYDFVYNRWNRLYTGFGVSLQRETPVDTTASITSDLAGVVTLVWKVYKYTNPKLWVDAGITFVPYFTTKGRYRTDINLSPKISVIGNDLKLGFKFYYSIDTKPLTEEASSTDWGINLEITYSFH